MEELLVSHWPGSVPTLCCDWLQVSGVVLGCWGHMEGDQFWVDELVFSRVFGGSSGGKKAGEERGSGRDLSLCVISGLELAGQDAGWLGSAEVKIFHFSENISVFQ